MFSKVLVANRGEIAVRVIRACRDLGITAVAVYSAADQQSLHVRLADEAYALPGRTPAETYLNVDALMSAVTESGAEAVHPGYGFLSESTDLAAALRAQGKTFVGPGTHAIEVMGSKTSARAAAEAAGVPVVPGLTTAISSAGEIRDFGREYGYPVAIKAAYGGGGRGMKVVADESQADAAYDSARREAAAYFGRDEVYLERYLGHPKHIEMQVIADQHGNAVWLGERDCSVQRRHQKLIEESPAQSLSADLRAQMGAAAIALTKAIDYVNAGTIEFLVEDGAFYFLEMNTRLQVEHPVTELVTGLDLVALQLRVAAGEPLGLSQDQVRSRGHAIEVRVNAEDPAGGRFVPAPGRISRLGLPDGYGIRVDAGYAAGDSVSEYYDGLVAKIVAWGTDRAAAIARMRRALSEFDIEGIRTTVPAQRLILDTPEFAADQHTTRWLEESLSLPEDLGHPPGDNTPEPAPAEEPAAGPDRSVAEINGRRYWIPVFGPGTEVPGVGAALPSPAPRLENRARTAAGTSADGIITAPMQGTVVAVAVEPGRPVAAGDLVCVLEAMKMENPIKAGRDGIVERVDIQPGSTVSAGQTLVVIA